MHHHFLVSKFKSLLCGEVLCILPQRAIRHLHRQEGRLGSLDSHATCSLHVITLGIFGEMPDTYYTIQAIIKVLWCFIWLKAAQSWGCRLKVLMSRSGDIAVCVLITPIPFLFIYTTSESRCSSHLCAFQGEKQINTFLTCQGWERLPISPVWVFNTCQVGM